LITLTTFSQECQCPTMETFSSLWILNVHIIMCHVCLLPLTSFSCNVSSLKHCSFTICYIFQEYSSHEWWRLVICLYLIFPKCPSCFVPIFHYYLASHWW
jgi:hypothetical protein